MSYHFCRFRLRKKTWKNPGTVFLDYHIYEEDINISSNWEVFLEVLDGINQYFCGEISVRNALKLIEAYNFLSNHEFLLSFLWVPFAF